jgi:hypothetical protein
MLPEDLHHAGPGLHRGNLLHERGERDSKCTWPGANIQDPGILRDVKTGDSNPDTVVIFTAGCGIVPLCILSFVPVM